MITKQKLAEVCDVAHAMTIVGGKWKMSIIWELRKGALRFSEIKKAMPGVSESVLILQLKELERDAILTRTDHKEWPLRVTYQLTPLGSALHAFLSQLETWGQTHRSQIKAKRSKQVA